MVSFYSSVGGAAIIESLLCELAKLGWGTTSCHAISEVEYRSKAGIVASFIRRCRMYLVFAVQCIYVARSHLSGVNIVTTNPFFAPWLVERCLTGRTRAINLVYDVFPDALIQAGVLREGSWLAQACACLTRRAFQRCDVTVFLGEHLRQYAEARYGPCRRAVVIPVGADGAPFRAHQPQYVQNEKIIVLYAGQMGRMHDIETLGNVLNRGLPLPLRFRFHASGIGYARLRDKCTSGACVWGVPLTDPEWRHIMLQCHVALVTMVPGAENVVMPSKTYGALVAGQAVLAICPLKSDLAALILRYDCGWVVEPGDAEGLSAVLQEIPSSPKELHRKRMNAYRIGHEYYCTSVLAKQWNRLLHELTA